jgi:hypothetical protein
MVALPQVAIMCGRFVLLQTASDRSTSLYVCLKAKTQVACTTDSYLGLCMTNDCNVLVNNNDKIKRSRSKQRLT